jgi:hypothetical protein
MFGIRLCIQDGETELLRITEDGMVLLPTEASERATVFLALTDALAILSGVTLPDNAAKATGADCVPRSSRYPVDGRKRGDVVPLRALRDNQTAEKTRE